MRNWFTGSFFRFALGFLAVLTVSFVALIVLSLYVEPQQVSGVAADIWRSVVGD